MKKLLSIAAILILTAVPMIHAGDSDKDTVIEDKSEDVVETEWASQKNLIVINPLDIIVGMFDVHCERALGSSNGMELGLNFTDNDLLGWKTQAIGAEVDYNFYFENHAPNGWFAGPRIYVQAADLDYTWKDSTTGIQQSHSTSIIVFGVDAQGGYRWMWKSGFTIDVLSSLGYSFGPSVRINDRRPFLIGHGIGISLGPDLGYAF